MKFGAANVDPRSIGQTVVLRNARTWGCSFLFFMPALASSCGLLSASQSVSDSAPPAEVVSPIVPADAAVRAGGALDGSDYEPAETRRRHWARPATLAEQIDLAHRLTRAGASADMLRHGSPGLGCEPDRLDAWHDFFDFDGDGIVDQPDLDYSGGGHCCYSLSMKLSRSRRTWTFPFQIDGGYVCGLDLSHREHFDVVDGGGFPAIYMEIETYTYHRKPIPRSWEKRYGVHSNWIRLDFHTGKPRFENLRGPPKIPERDPSTPEPPLPAPLPRPPPPHDR